VLPLPKPTTMPVSTCFTALMAALFLAAVVQLVA